MLQELFPCLLWANKIEKATEFCFFLLLENVELA